MCGTKTKPLNFLLLETLITLNDIGGLSPDEIKETLDSTSLSLGLLGQYNIYKLTGTCTLKALNA